jgi:hypothetical protein
MRKEGGATAWASVVKSGTMDGGGVVDSVRCATPGNGRRYIRAVYANSYLWSSTLYQVTGAGSFEIIF